MRISLIALNARYTHSCAALFYVRQALVKHVPECEVRLQQYTINDPYYETLLRITAQKPDAFFVSVYIWSALSIRRLIADLKTGMPDVPIVLGGPEAANLPADLLQTGCTVILGEVEGLGAAFYEDLRAGSLQGEYRAAPAPAFSMPYRAEDFAGELKNRNIYYESARGCPFACTYCLSSLERRIVTRATAEVREELAEILQQQPKIIRFVDRTFNASPKRALELWQYLAEYGGDTMFHFEIAPDLFDEEMLRFLAEMKPGQFQFEIGLQSTNMETLRAIRRTMDLEKARANICRLAAPDNIHLHLDLILGLPFETPATFQKSFNEAFFMAPHHIQMGLLKVLPGTAMSRAAEEFGLRRCADPPYSLISSSWMDHDVLAGLFWFGECVEAFYNNRFFRSLWRYIREREPEPFAFFAELLEVCRQNGFFERAKTQEVMSRLLLLLAENREDGPLLAELLRYDWLRCGHRFLPEHLSAVPMHEARDLLWHGLPEDLPPFFSPATRSEFFKRSTFHRFSGNLLRQVGLADGGQSAVVCFLPQQTPGVLGHQQTAVIL